MLRRIGMVILGLLLSELAWSAQPAKLDKAQLPRVQVNRNGSGFITEHGKPFVPFGLTYFRANTGWAPQVWKKFDAEATRQDFARMQKLGINCVRVFISFGSFYSEPGKLDPDGLAKFDQFLAIAEEHGIYVHPTGPDHWEGLPDWAKIDRYADEPVLSALEKFWSLFAARYRGRTVIFAYDLLNEPHVMWDSEPMRAKWNDWLKREYRTAPHLAYSWKRTLPPAELGEFPIPKPVAAAGSRELLDYQKFREEIADEWTRRQVVALKAADPQALVTVGYVQWSVPSLMPDVKHYAAARPSRQAQWLDFLEIHFYPLDHGAFDYRSDEAENRNLAYAHGVVAEVAKLGKPVVLAEFGWYGGGKPRFDGGKHPFATEVNQAKWCRRLVETTTGLACGWLNWGLYDQPEATDPSEFSGLLTATGEMKAWGREFEKLAKRDAKAVTTATQPKLGMELDWNASVTDPAVGNRWRREYFEKFSAAFPLAKEAGVSDRAVAFYYPWYGNPAKDGRYANWNHPVAVRNEPPRSFPGGDDIGANFYPAPGCYSVNDPEVLRDHMRQLRQAGVGVICASWWGRDSFTDRALPGLFKAAEAAGLKINFHLEPFNGRNTKTTREAIAYLLGKFGASPALHRLASHGNRPLFFVYDSYHTPASEWATILNNDGTQTIRGTTNDAVVIGLWVKEHEERFMLDGSFDGFYTYFATDGFTFGSTTKNWSKLADWARANSKLFIPCIAPGYIDTRIRPWNNVNTREREHGAYYDRMWSAALGVKPELVGITSFNEWHEGTQIEPAAPKQIPGFTYLDYQPRAPDYYLDRTAHWIEIWKGK